MAVLIRAWTEADLENLVANANNIKIWNNLRNYFPSPYTEEAGKNWLAQIIGAEPLANFAIDVDGALARLLQKVQTAQEGALARAGGADDADHIPGLGAQRNSLDHLVIAVLFVQLFHRQLVILHVLHRF